MTPRAWLLAPVAAVLVGPLLVAVPATATTTPGPTPSSPVVVIGPQPTGTPTRLVVEDLVFGDDTLRLSESSLDGAAVDEGGGAFRLNSDVLFAFDEAVLTTRARSELARVVAGLKKDSATRVRVTGYTDEVGSDGYNLRLSRRRADAVRTALAGRLGAGITVTATGQGEAAPIADNKTRAGRTLNRRVEIRAT